MGNVCPWGSRCTPAPPSSCSRGSQRADSSRWGAGPRAQHRLANKRKPKRSGCFLLRTQGLSQPLGVCRGEGGPELKLRGLCDRPNVIPGRIQDPAPHTNTHIAPVPVSRGLGHCRPWLLTESRAGRSGARAGVPGCLQQLGPGSFLSGGRRVGLWAVDAGTCSAPPPHTHTHTSRVRSSRCHEPQKRTSAQQLPIYTFAEASHLSLEAAWLPSPVRLARGEGRRRLPFADPESGEAVPQYPPGFPTSRNLPSGRGGSLCRPRNSACGGRD